MKPNKLNLNLKESKGYALRYNSEGMTDQGLSYPKIV